MDIGSVKKKKKQNLNGGKKNEGMLGVKEKEKPAAK